MNELSPSARAGHAPNRRRAHVLLTAALGGLALAGVLGASGCEEIAAVDESRIPAEAADADVDATDGGTDGRVVDDAGADSVVPDAETDDGAHGGAKG